MSVTNSNSASRRLAETLSILKFYPRTFLNSGEPHSYHRQLVGSTLSEDRSDDFERDIEILRMLNTVAVYLSTADKGNFTAAAIEGSVKSNDPITLVVARARNSTHYDQEIADEFLCILKSSTDFQQALRFLVIHGREILNKYIRTLRQSYFKELHSFLSTHSFRRSAEEEFCNRSTTTVLNNEKLRNKSVREILEELLRFVCSIQELDNDIEASHTRFTNLVLYALILKSSRYMSFLIQSCIDTDADWQLQLKDFWNALDRIAYFQRVDKLMKFVSGRLVSVRWANNISYTATESADQVSCRPPSKLASQLFKKFLIPDPRIGSPLPLDIQEKRLKGLKVLVEQKAPSGYWDAHAQISLSIHPEIRIVLDPAMALAPHHLIGCSTSTCLCCTLWLDAYSRFEPSVPRWWLGRFGQEIDIGWALPGESTGLTAIFPLDQVILKDVEKELHFRMHEHIDTFQLQYP